MSDHTRPAQLSRPTALPGIEASAPLAQRGQGGLRLPAKCEGQGLRPGYRPHLALPRPINASFVPQTQQVRMQATVRRPHLPANCPGEFFAASGGQTHTDESEAR
jgi:hypothetical protein